MLRPVDIGIPSEYPEQAGNSALQEDQLGAMWIAAPSGLYRGRTDSSSVNYTRLDGNQEFNASQLRDSIPGRFVLDGERYGILVSVAALRRRIPPGVMASNRMPTWCTWSCETAPVDANNMPAKGDLPCRFEQFQVIVAEDPRSGLQPEEIRAPDKGEAEQASDVCRLFNAQFAPHTSLDTGIYSPLTHHKDSPLQSHVSRISIFLLIGIVRRSFRLR